MHHIGRCDIMSKLLSISDELYIRMKPKTNNEGGRSVKKVSFDAVISSALNDQDRYKKRKVGK